MFVLVTNRNLLAFQKLQKQIAKKNGREQKLCALVYGFSELTKLAVVEMLAMKSISLESESKASSTVVLICLTAGSERCDFFDLRLLSQNDCALRNLGISVPKLDISLSLVCALRSRIDMYSAFHLYGASCGH